MPKDELAILLLQRNLARYKSALLIGKAGDCQYLRKFFYLSHDIFIPASALLFLKMLI